MTPLTRSLPTSPVHPAEGERALIHVPSAEGYGAAPQGSKGGAWYIPGGSNLLFDIQIVSKSGAGAAAREL